MPAPGGGSMPGFGAGAPTAKGRLRECLSRFIRPEDMPIQVALFIPCFVDQLNPQVGLDAARVLRRIGCAVDFPEAQTCCGQPAFNTGYWQEARPLAERFV